MHSDGYTYLPYLDVYITWLQFKDENYNNVISIHPILGIPFKSLLMYPGERHDRNIDKK